MIFQRYSIDGIALQKYPPCFSVLGAHPAIHLHTFLSQWQGLCFVQNCVMDLEIFHLSPYTMEARTKTTSTRFWKIITSLIYKLLINKDNNNNNNNNNNNFWPGICIKHHIHPRHPHQNTLHQHCWTPRSSRLMVSPFCHSGKRQTGRKKRPGFGQGDAAGWIAEEPFVCYSYTAWDWNIYLCLYYVYHKCRPYVGKYSIHGAYGLETCISTFQMEAGFKIWNRQCLWESTAFLGFEEIAQTEDVSKSEFTAKETNLNMFDMIALMILRKTLRFWVTPTWFTTLLTCFRVLSKLLGQVGFLLQSRGVWRWWMSKHLIMVCKPYVVNHLNISTVWPKKVSVSNQSATRAPFLTF